MILAVTKRAPAHFEPRPLGVLWPVQDAAVALEGAKQAEVSAPRSPYLVMTNRKL